MRWNVTSTLTRPTSCYIENWLTGTQVIKAVNIAKILSSYLLVALSNFHHLANEPELGETKSGEASVNPFVPDKAIISQQPHQLTTSPWDQPGLAQTRRLFKWAQWTELWDKQTAVVSSPSILGSFVPQQLPASPRALEQPHPCIYSSGIGALKSRADESFYNMVLMEHLW